jgi:hypothetical protein
VKWQQLAVNEISCSVCAFPVPTELWNREEGARCPGCGQRVQALVFPAIGRKRTAELPQPLGAEEEASCFYHPQSRAAVPCDDCGRFLCQLCDLAMDGRHICPACFETGLAAKRIETVESRRTMYDTVALALATLPALLIWPVIITAPLALSIVFRRWGAPGSLVPRTRIRFYLAGLFALAEIAGIGFIIWTMMRLPGRVVTR